LLELAARHVQELSGGERKRVFLARALAQEPKIALLDEPTAFLDLKHVAEIFARFRELCIERGMAVVATLHDLNAAALYADRVLLLADGAAVGDADLGISRVEIHAAVRRAEIMLIKTHGYGRRPYVIALHQAAAELAPAGNDGLRDEIERIGAHLLERECALL